MQRKTRLTTALLSAGTLALCFAGSANAQSYQTLPIDRGTNVDNVQFACTGVGNAEEQNARWDRYPVKVETVGDHGEYLAGETITLRNSDGNTMTPVKCDAPWVLMRLQPGRYSATVQAPGGAEKQISLRVPENGSQRDVIVRFANQSAANDDGVMLPSG